MTTHLSEIVARNFDLIKRANSPGAILKILPSLIESLADSKNLSPFMQRIENDLKVREAEALKNLKEAVHWVVERLTRLKTSPYAKHPLVEGCIKRVEEALQFKGYFPPTSYLDFLLQSLKIAVDSIASFGSDLLFDGWAILGSRRVSPSCSSPIFDKKACGTFPISDPWDLAEKMGHGIDCWEVALGASNQPLIYIRVGCFYEFIYPPCIEALQKSREKKGQQEWRELCDSDPVTLYAYLKILAQYSSYKSLAQSLHLPPVESLEEAELRCVRIYIGYMLSCFASSDPKQHPHTAEQLIRYIETFLNMAEIAAMDVKQLSKTDRVERINPDEIKVKNFILKTRRNNPEISRGSMVAKIEASKLTLGRAYTASTYKQWDRDVDPEKDMKTKLSRPKTVNR